MIYSDIGRQHVGSCNAGASDGIHTALIEEVDAVRTALADAVLQRNLISDAVSEVGLQGLVIDVLEGYKEQHSQKNIML